jgi:serine/threonine protein kinase
MARHIQTQLPVAVKVIPKSRVQSDDDRTRVNREAEFLRTVRHPNIIAFYEFIEDSSNYYIVMEAAENGTLLEMISVNQSLAESAARPYLRQIASAVQYLHETMHIVHRDLKCENLMFDRHMNIRLIDFELSHTNDSIMQTVCGTVAYTAPEMLTGGGYGPSVDVWSLGVILYAMITGRFPFGDQSLDSILKLIQYTNPLEGSQFSDDLADLLSKMFEKDPVTRISIEGVLDHPWMKGCNFGPLDATLIHDRVIEKLTLLGIGETAELIDTPAYRIVYRSIETDLGGSTIRSSKSLRSFAPRSSAGVPVRPVLMKPSLATRTGSTVISDLCRLSPKPNPTPPQCGPHPPIKISGVANRRKWKTLS